MVFGLDNHYKVNAGVFVVGGEREPFAWRPIRIDIYIYTPAGELPDFQEATELTHCGNFPK